MILFYFPLIIGGADIVVPNACLRFEKNFFNSNKSHQTTF